MKIQPLYQGNINAAVILMGNDTYGLRTDEFELDLLYQLFDEELQFKSRKDDYKVIQMFRKINDKAIKRLLNQINKLNKGKFHIESLEGILE
jgi:hypothetical protein